MKGLKYPAYGLLAFAIVYVAFQIVHTYTRIPRLKAAAEKHRIEGPDVDLVVVEFLNYTCIYCREVHPTIMEAVRRDGKVRYLPRPVATDVMTSAPMALLAYAGAEQGKFVETHNALMNNYQVTFDDEYISKISKIAGLDSLKAANDMRDPRVGIHVENNANLYNELGLKATPTFIIGDTITFVPQDKMPDVEDFLQMFEEARKAKDKTAS